MKCKYCHQEVLPDEPYVADHPLGENKSHLKCFKRWLWVKERGEVEEALKLLDNKGLK